MYVYTYYVNVYIKATIALVEPQAPSHPKSHHNANLHRNHNTNPRGSNARAVVAWVVQLNRTQREPIRIKTQVPWD